MKIIIFLMLLFSLSRISLANGKYFEFFTKNNVISSENRIEIEVLFNLNNIFTQRFRVKPISTNSFIKIWNNEKELWIFGNSLWSDMPALTKNMELMFESSNFVNSEVYLLIQDMQTSEIYKTSKQKVWSRNWFIEYISRINQGLFKMIE